MSNVIIAPMKLHKNAFVKVCNGDTLKAFIDACLHFMTGQRSLTFFLFINGCYLNFLFSLNYITIFIISIAYCYYM